MKLPQPADGRHFKWDPLRIADFDYSEKTLIRVGGQELVCWLSTKGPVEPSTEKTKYVEDEGLRTRGGLAKSVQAREEKSF